MKDYLNYIVTVVISLAVGAGVTFYVLDSDNKAKMVETVEKTVSEVNITESDSLKTSLSKVYKSVFVIEAYTTNSRLASSGSGFVYKVDDKYGYLLTNNHVVENSGSIKVINMDGAEVDAELLGEDIYMDIAVLRIDKDAVLQVAPLPSSNNIGIGDTVFTVGAPGGREYIGTVTKGIISGLNREVAVQLSSGGNFIMDVIQTDAAINPGNSGGPLVNINGEVIGINSLKIIQDSIEGMGFALPIEEVMVYVDRLEAGETIQRPVVGIELLEVSDRYRLQQYQISLDSSVTYGVVIVRVSPGFPAEAAGLKSGDVILEINGNKVNDSAHFRFLLYKHSVGDTISLKYNRSGKENTIKVKLTK